MPLLAMLFVGAELSGLLHGLGLAPIPIAICLLGGAVFAAVQHAEVLAHRIGQPFGSLILALAVTVIEVSLIISVLLGGAEGADQVARDTVYAAVMLVLNGIVGLSLVLGGLKHREQTFQIDSASATLAVLGTLSVFTLVMPNFTKATIGASYTPLQLFVVGFSSIILYGVFLFVQTVRHRDRFVDGDELVTPSHAPTPPRAVALAGLLLVVALLSVIGIAEFLSLPLEQAISGAHLERSLVGVVIAAIVLMPEGLSALRAARQNRLQSSINMALGSALASTGLTIPTVAAVSLFTGRTLVLGLGQEDTALLLLTLFISSQTLGTGRTTLLQGFVHLVILAVFLVLAAVP